MCCVVEFTFVARYHGRVGSAGASGPIGEGAANALDGTARYSSIGALLRNPDGRGCESFSISRNHSIFVFNFRLNFWSLLKFLKLVFLHI